MTKECVKVPMMFESEEKLQAFLDELSDYQQWVGTICEQSPVVVAGKYGFANWSSCEVAIKPQYDAYEGDFSYRTPYSCVCNGEKWGVIRYDGNIEVPIQCTQNLAIVMRDTLNARSVILTKDVDIPEVS
jgi:hypothetical protein